MIQSMRTVILCSILLFTAISLSAQYWVKDGQGRYVVYYGSFIKTGQTSESGGGTEIISSFDTLHYWDWEDEALGDFTNTEINAKFNVYAIHQSMDTIVEDEINGVSTKVLKMSHPANETGQGVQWYFYFDDDQTQYEEVYLSYMMKFDAEMDHTAGGKLPGLRGFPFIDGSATIDTTEGFYYSPMFKRHGYLHDYHYGRSKGTALSSYPWAQEEYVGPDSVWMANGVWYNITQRLVMNTRSTPGSYSNDGVEEYWINGVLAHQLDTLTIQQAHGKAIDGITMAYFYGGSSSSYEPPNASSMYIGPMMLWVPSTGGDSVSGHNTYHPSTILPHPLEVTDREFYYDTFVDSEGTISSPGYPTSLPASSDQTWLIDAGAGNTVTFTPTGGVSGGGDRIFFYDGKNADDPILVWWDDYSEDLSAESAVTSTGRYLFIRMSSDQDSPYFRLTGTVAFNTSLTDYGDTLMYFGFDDLSLDASFTESDLQNYFGTYWASEAYYNQAPAIVNATKNGATTKVLRIPHEPGYPTESWVYSGLTDDITHN